MEDKTQKRQVAYKIRIKDILDGKYVREEGDWVPNYIEIGNRKISRANIIATVVAKQPLEGTNYQSILVDDGSGKIIVRSFEENDSFKDIKIGDFVLIIGRPREYLNEKYIVAEIIKKIENPLWIEVRKLELENKKEIHKKDENKNKVEQIVTEEETIQDDINSKIFRLIKEMDQGNGVEIDEVVSKSKVEKAEEIINKLLRAGEIFEIKPGKLKVLE